MRCEDQWSTLIRTKKNFDTVEQKKKRKRKLDPITVFESGVLFVTLGSPGGRFTTKAAEKTGISLSPRLENSSLLALAALNFALSAISRNRHVKRAAASALSAQHCALYFLPPEELRAVSRRRRGRAKEGEERRKRGKEWSVGNREMQKDRGGKKEKRENGRGEGASFEKSLMESLGPGMAVRARGRERSGCTVINDRSDGVRP